MNLTFKRQILLLWIQVYTYLEMLQFIVLLQLNSRVLSLPAHKQNLVAGFFSRLLSPSWSSEPRASLAQPFTRAVVAVYLSSTIVSRNLHSSTPLFSTYWDYHFDIQ